MMPIWHDFVARQMSVLDAAKIASFLNCLDIGVCDPCEDIGSVNEEFGAMFAVDER